MSNTILIGYVDCINNDKCDIDGNVDCIKMTKYDIDDYVDCIKMTNTILMVM